MTGIELIAEERQEQIEKHGRSIEQDVAFNKNGQIIDWVKQMIHTERQVYGFTPPEGWDVFICGKMIGKSYKDRLVIAGALIAAEIDRLQASSV